MVFCESCRHFRGHASGLREVCLANPWVEVTYYTQALVYAQPHSKNANNDCSDYQTSLRSRFIAWLFTP